MNKRQRKKFAYSMVWKERFAKRMNRRWQATGSGSRYVRFDKINWGAFDGTIGIAALGVSVYTPDTTTRK